MTELEPEERVIQAMEQTAELYNFNPSYARMYGTLYFQDEMTLDQLSEELELSKSTVSRGMNKLEDMYLVKSTKKEEHGKTKFYSAEEDLEDAFMKFVENEGTREIEIMTQALEKAEEGMKEKDDQEGLEKIRNLQNFYSRSEKLLNLMKKMPSGKSLDKVFKTLDKIKPGSD